ncbi:MAG: glycosyltransferase family 4 protein [candidate division WOR-3 bacterium]
MIIILSPWEYDWDENVFGSPNNYYLLKEFLKNDVEVEWVYIGEKEYDSIKRVRFLRIPAYKIKRPARFYYKILNQIVFNFLKKLKKDYKIIIVFSSNLYEAGYRFAKERNIKLVNKHFGIPFNPYLKNMNKFLIRWKYHIFLNCFKKRADYYVMEDDGSGIEKLTSFFKIPSDRVLINIQPKPDEIIFDPIYKKENFINVGFCGRFEKDRGFDYFLKICEGIKDMDRIHLIVAGKGSGVKKLEKLKEKMREKLTYIGSLPYFMMYKFYSSIDILINTTPHANITRPVVEAFSYGKPVLSFDVTPYTIIKNRENGFLIKPYKIEEFINCIKNLAQNKDLLKTLSENAFRTSLKIPKFSENMKKEVEFYKSILL